MQQVRIVEVDKPEGKFINSAVELLDTTQCKGIFYDGCRCGAIFFARVLDDSRTGVQ